MHRLISLTLVLGLVGCDTPTSIETIVIEDAISTITVKSGDGDVTVAPSEDGAITAQVALTGKGTKFSYEVKDGELTLKKRCGFMNVGTCVTDFEITAPVNIAVNIKTGKGDVSVTDWQGPMDIETGSGAVTVRLSSGNLLVDTGTGTISAKEMSSNHIALLGGPGDIELDVVDDEFEDILVDNGSGDAILYLPAGGTYNLTAESSSGQTVVNGLSQSSNSKHIVEVYTGSGDISVQGQ